MNLYLEKIKTCDLEFLHYSQSKFNFLIQDWTYIFTRLLNKIDDEKLSEILIENLKDESGNGDSNNSHVNTHKYLLDNINVNYYNPDKNKPSDLLYEQFTKEIYNVIDTKSWEYSFSLLGYIELYYAKYSDKLGRVLQDRNIQQNHYKIHAELDIYHSQRLLEPIKTNEILNWGNKLSLKLLDTLYLNMTTLYPHKLFFGKVFEDYKNIEGNLIKDNYNVACIGSGGDSSIYYLNNYKNIHLDIIDNNIDQLKIIEDRLNNIYIETFGIYDDIFILNKQTNGKYKNILFSNKYLNLIFGKDVVDNNYNYREHFENIEEDKLFKLAEKTEQIYLIKHNNCNCKMYGIDILSYLKSKCDNSLDFITISNILDWSDERKKSEILNELIRVVKKDGIIVNRTIQGNELDKHGFFNKKIVYDNTGLYKITQILTNLK